MGPAPRLSPLAVIALVVALIPLCPPLNFLGAALAVVAVRRIDRSAGQVTGRKAAKAAMFFGLLMGIAGWWFWSGVATWLETQMQTRTNEVARGFFEDVSTDDMDGMQQWWASDSPELEDSTTPTVEQLTRFAEAMHATGELKHVQVRDVKTVGGFNGAIEAWVVLTLGDRQVNGGIRLHVVLEGITVPVLKAQLISCRLDLPSGEQRLGRRPPVTAEDAE